MNEIESSAKRLSSRSSIFPGVFELIISFIFTTLLIFVASIESIATFLRISYQEKQDLAGYLSDGLTIFTTAFDSFSYSAIAVTFIINFFVGYTIVSSTYYAKDLYKELKLDMTNNGSTGTRNFWGHVLFYGFKRLFSTLFIIFWFLAFIFYLIPLGIKSSSIYLRDAGNVSNIIYLIIGVFIIYAGVLSIIMYSKYKFIYKSIETPI